MFTHLRRFFLNHSFFSFIGFSKFSCFLFTTINTTFENNILNFDNFCIVVFKFLVSPLIIESFKVCLNR